MFDDKPDWQPAVYGDDEYYGYPNKAAEFYLDNNLIPVTPNIWKVNNENCNESTQTTQGFPMTIPKLDKAQQFEMEFIFLHDQRFVRNRYSTFMKQTSDNLSGEAQTWFEVKDLTDYLWQVKQDRNPVVITIIYPFQENLNLKALLDDYSYTQDATFASDYKFTLSFTEFHEPLNQEVDIELKNTLIRHNIRTLRTAADKPAFNPDTYEAETGKHSMSWEEMKEQMDNWMNTEYKKTHDDKDMPSFEEAFKEWWESDPDRAGLHMPDSPKELGYWWNDFIEKSNQEQTNAKSREELEAWLDAEVKKLTDNPPADFWEKFKLWWRSDSTRDSTLHRPTSDEELLNWWNDFSAQSKAYNDRVQKLADIKAWILEECKKLGWETHPDDWMKDFRAWWAANPELSGMHCPDDTKEILNWWDDFHEKSDADLSLLPDIEHWLNVEVSKLTDDPPDSMKGKLKLWWNSDESRKGTRIPETDQELVNWWKDFMEKSQEEQVTNQTMLEIDTWLTRELDKWVLDVPDDFWERYRLWWNHEDRGEMHMPDNQGELFNWWADFKANLQRQRAVRAWLDSELPKIGEEPTGDLYADLKTWWESDDSRVDMHCPDNDSELYNWWDDFEAIKNKQIEDKINLIKAWLKGEFEKLGYKLLDNLYTNLKIWWDTDESREDLHCPDNQEELFVWWDDFIAQSESE